MNDEHSDASRQVRRCREGIGKAQKDIITRKEQTGDVALGSCSLVRWGRHNYVGDMGAYVASCNSRIKHSSELGAKIVVEELCEDVGGPGRLQLYIDVI